MSIPPPAAPSIPPEDVERILTYLSLPSSPLLPSPPLTFLSTYLPILPLPLLTPFSPLLSPRLRSRVPTIKSRRMAYAQRIPLPAVLRANRGRLRWPLLWERMGGSPLPPLSDDTDDDEDDEDEEAWVKQRFMVGASDGSGATEVGKQHVRKLGGFLRGLQEEREWEVVVEAKKRERGMDQGEEFDSESDEEGAAAVVDRVEVADDQEEVRRAFEKRLVEMFVDGLDTIDYDPVDYVEPPGGDPIGSQDAEDAYFEEEQPSEKSRKAEQAEKAEDARVSTDGHDRGQLDGREDAVSAKTQARLSREWDAKWSQNGQGDYDY